MNSKLSFHEKLPPKSFLADLKVGIKLSIGFLILIVLIFLVTLVSYASSRNNLVQIRDAGRLRLPLSQTASTAQFNLSRMLSDVRGYLALGDSPYRESYQNSAALFENNLAQLQSQSDYLSPKDKDRLDKLRKYYEQWKPLPEQLFELRDSQLHREPAYKMLATDGVEHAGIVIISLNQMIRRQSQQTPSVENMAIMADMSQFQGSFLAMLSAMRGYVSTRNRVYRYEYEANWVVNDESWNRLLQDKRNLNESQNELADVIKQERQAFIDMPDEIFKTLESETWRLDLYRFKVEAEPLASQMDRALSELATSQQEALSGEIEASSVDPIATYGVIWGSSIVSVFIGVALMIASHRVISMPISRLTNVARQIRSGDLEAQAAVESRDDIGILASTFNSMTVKLRDTLFQVRKEKNRADKLLKVVIPMGVELTYQKNLQKLLEDVLRESKSVSNADGGTFYLRKENTLEFVVMHNDTLNIDEGGTSKKAVAIPPLNLYKENGEPNHHNLATYAALTGETVNVEDVYQNAGFDFSGVKEFDKRNNYKTISSLTIPLKNASNEVKGVLQLVNARDLETQQVISFDENLQEMMESFSTLAIAALESFVREQALRQEINELHIEIDQVKRKKQVDEIVESDFFQDLSSRAKDMRNRSKPERKNT